jgi:hypothetical protein
VLAASRAFGLLAPCFGVLVLILTPPFQAPDEFNHFFRAYLISEGRLLAHTNQPSWCPSAWRRR